MFKYVQMRKQQLPKRATRRSELKIVQLKPTPVYQLLDITNRSRDQRRIFNRTLEKLVKRYENQCLLNIENVYPNNAKCYKFHTGFLSKRGFDEFWKSVDIIPLKRIIFESGGDNNANYKREVLKRRSNNGWCKHQISMK